MSLCPHYCECRLCDHGVPSCEWCEDCRELADRRAQQRGHLASVARQRAKIKKISPPKQISVDNNQK